MTKPSLNLFPEPEPLTETPSWQDIERLAMNYPSVHLAVTRVERGDITREQALVTLVHWFATAFSRQFRREADAMAMEMPDTISQAQCGCSTTTYVRRRTVEFPCEAHRAT